MPRGPELCTGALVNYDQGLSPSWEERQPIDNCMSKATRIRFRAVRSPRGCGAAALAGGH